MLIKYIAKVFLCLHANYSSIGFTACSLSPVLSIEIIFEWWELVEKEREIITVPSILYCILPFLKKLGVSLSASCCILFISAEDFHITQQPYFFFTFLILWWNEVIVVWNKMGGGRMNGCCKETFFFTFQ